MFLHSCYSYKYKITHADTHKQGFFPPLFVPGRDSSCVEPSSEVLSLGSRGPADAAAALFLSLSLSLSLPQSVYVCLWLASTAALLLFTPALTLTFIECRSWRRKSSRDRKLSQTAGASWKKNNPDLISEMLIQVSLSRNNEWSSIQHFNMHSRQVHTHIHHFFFVQQLSSLSVSVCSGLYSLCWLFGAMRYLLTCSIYSSKAVNWFTGSFNGCATVYHVTTQMECEG